MGYYDGNTVTAIWNYAQNFAISDNFYGTTFGQSAPGHINLVSGQTHGVVVLNAAAGIDLAVIDGTLYGDTAPAFDDCDTTGRSRAITFRCLVIGRGMIGAVIGPDWRCSPDLTA